MTLPNDEKNNYFEKIRSQLEEAVEDGSIASCFTVMVRFICKHFNESDRETMVYELQQTIAGLMKNKMRCKHCGQPFDSWMENTLEEPIFYSIVFYCKPCNQGWRMKAEPLMEEEPNSETETF